MPPAATAFFAISQSLSFFAFSVSSQWGQKKINLFVKEGCKSEFVLSLPPWGGLAEQEGGTRGKPVQLASTEGYYPFLPFFIWLICSGSIFGNINPVSWD